MTEKTHTCQCCIAGGGPAGMMLGLLLARAGVEVIVLEKHADFLRDFRGDTIHPSTLEVMHELGLLERFLQLPHQRAETFNVFVGGQKVQMMSFSHLPVQCKFVAMMPQWDFLNFLAAEGKAYSGFQVLMSTEANDLITEGDRVTGLTATSEGASMSVKAPLVVAADGRWSVLRDKSGLKVRELGAPIDVLWFRVPRLPSDGEEMGVNMHPGELLVRLNRADYWQAAYIIPKGGLDEIKQQGLASFRKRVARAMNFDIKRVECLATWDDVKLLSVAVNRLDTWYKKGFLVIGDAAHAMSPAGGVGVNLAIQDAVVAANHLHDALRKNQQISPGRLAAIQKRRLWPTRLLQKMQVAAHKTIIEKALTASVDDPDFVPTPVKIMQRFPFLQRIPARMVGLGVRMEHVAPAIRSPSPTIRSPSPT